MTGSEITAFLAGADCANPAVAFLPDPPEMGDLSVTGWTPAELEAYNRLGPDLFMHWFIRGAVEGRREH